jgi:serine phosphatase RsbU (regulator of sigma subunit)
MADVCAFGPVFSEIAGQLRDLMKRNVNAISQSRIVRDVGLRLEEAAHNDGFASTLISTYFAPTRSLSLCNAGHPPPLLFRSSEAQWSVLKRAPADAVAGEASTGVVHPGEYQQLKTILGVGDMVLSYSNVLTECRDRAGQTIGLHGLLGRVCRLDTRRPADLSLALLSQLRDEHPENLAAQDATILLCRATETEVTWRDNLLAPLRLLRSVSDKTRIE